MNLVDLALIVILILFAVRGYWRGFFRELCGILGLAAGIAVALSFAPAVAAWLTERVFAPAPIDLALAFVGLFVVAQVIASIAGMILERMARALWLGVVSRMLGAIVAAAEGAAVLAVVLLFFHLFPVFSKLDQPIMNSAIGRSLISAASTCVRLASHPAPADSTQS